MKLYEKIILTTLLIGATIAIIAVASHDAKAKTGAFAQTQDVYPVTNAILTQKKAENGRAAAELDKMTEQETNAPEMAEIEAETEPTEPETETQPDEELHILETKAPADYNDGVYRGDIYQIAGIELDPEIGDFLVAELDKYGITDQWLHIALATMFQESRFDPLARNKNGLDMGILQYRVTYWDWSRGDIFDWRAQIQLYCEQTARRLASGCSIWETISRHNTSDWGTYNAEYVAQVMQWIPEE